MHPECPKSLKMSHGMLNLDLVWSSYEHFSGSEEHSAMWHKELSRMYPICGNHGLKSKYIRESLLPHIIE